MLAGMRQKNFPGREKNTVQEPYSENKFGVIITMKRSV